MVHEQTDPERVDVDEEIRRSYKEGYLNAIHDISKALRELYAVKDTELDECVTKES